MSIRLNEQWNEQWNEHLIEQALKWRFERDEEAWEKFAAGIKAVAGTEVGAARRWLVRTEGALDVADLKQEADLAVVEWVMGLQPPITEPLDVAAEVRRVIIRRFDQVRGEFVRKGCRPRRSTRDTRSPKSRYPDHLRGQLPADPCLYRNPASCLEMAELLIAVLQECTTDAERELVLLLCEAPTDQGLGESLGISADTAKHLRRRFQAKIAHLLVDWDWCLRHDQKTISPPPQTPILKCGVATYPKPLALRGEVEEVVA